MEVLKTAVPELVNPMTYPEFRNLSQTLVLQNETTGAEQTEEKIAFTKLNQQRIKRVEKQFVMLPELATLLAGKSVNWKWLVLVEAWCGDGAQVLPAIAAVADELQGVELTVLLRDENPELMETCLTNGSRSIPKLICINASTGDRIFTWGPRPATIQEKVLQFKAENPGVDHAAFVLQLHTWYAKDKSLSLQQDLLDLLKQFL